MSTLLRWIRLDWLSLLYRLIATRLRNFPQRMRSLDTSLRCATHLHACYRGELSQWSPGWVEHEALPAQKCRYSGSVSSELQRALATGDFRNAQHSPRKENSSFSSSTYLRRQDWYKTHPFNKNKRVVKTCESRS
jgi:hypothetical protein